LTEVYTTNGTYYLDSSLKSQLSNNYTILTAYDDAPAIKSELSGAIVSVNNISIKNSNDLKIIFSTSKPGENMTIATIQNNKINYYNITLAVNPSNNSIGYLGVGSLKPQTTGVVAGLVNLFTSFRDSSIYYQPKANSELVIFIYDLLWWVMIINFLVGLFNMLPLGFLDGGRFFYLTILSVTKSKKISEYSFRYISYAIGLVFLLMLFFWFIAII
jgi:membrane-associated protease RseP (regulator of RpoE activity)